jgi:hypothetical protein
MTNLQTGRAETPSPPEVPVQPQPGPEIEPARLPDPEVPQLPPDPTTPFYP